LLCTFVMAAASGDVPLSTPVSQGYRVPEYY
jgi:hypothetical protein